MRRALTAVDYGQAGGQVLPVEILRDRVSRLQGMRRGCRFAEAATDLPVLISDLHTALAAGRDVDQLLPLAVYLHVQVTSMWLLDAGAPLICDVRSPRWPGGWPRSTATAPRWGWLPSPPRACVVSEDQSDLARAELEAVPLLTTRPETAGLVGVLMIRHATVAAA